MPRRALATAFAAIQWLGFMFANTVVIPLSVSPAFHLTAAETSGVMARSFIVTGLACLLQAWMGHRLPLMEGQSGLWWGVLLTLASTGTAGGQSLAAIGGSAEMGMLLGGVLLMVCGWLGLHRVLNRLFTPMVMAVLLILLASQLIDIFFHGMMGLSGSERISPHTALLSILLVALVGTLTVAGRGWLSNFSILIGLAVGWVAYDAWVGGAPAVATPQWSEIARPFSWGNPAFSSGILLTCALTALLNTTNTIATLRAAEPVFDQPLPDRTYQRSLFLSGLYTAISGPLSLVAYAPYTSSIGFLRTTRILDRLPYVIGAGLFVLLGAVPGWAAWFATLPVSVGDAVLFVAYLQLFGSALENLQGTKFTFRTVYRIALPVLAGLAILSTPKTAFATLPPFAESILGNGMLVGILLSVLLEHCVPWQRVNGVASPHPADPSTHAAHVD
ncbi:MAG: uracil/xanthine transporter [Alicyclobacillus sp.]|nr:uracil/xanthine transporter [Alicyclobacillus sp.]